MPPKRRSFYGYYNSLFIISQVQNTVLHPIQRFAIISWERSSDLAVSFPRKGVVGMTIADAIVLLIAATGYLLVLTKK